MKQKGLTPEQRERRRLRAQKYYLEHREEILAHNREYYRKKGRAWNAERARKYRQANHEAYRAKCREYRANHREHIRQMDKKYRQKCRQNYFQRHCVSISQKTIGEYCYRAIKRVQQECPEKVERLLEQYPFEGFASKCLRKQLQCLHIFPPQARYDDCYDAGMMAYLYTYGNLATEFGVSRETIRHDIVLLMCSYPIETVRGRYGGGVRVKADFLPYRKALNKKQVRLLVKLSAQLGGDDLATISSIIFQLAP